jgi:hypothetical protein
MIRNMLIDESIVWAMVCSDYETAGRLRIVTINDPRRDDIGSTSNREERGRLAPLTA